MPSDVNLSISADIVKPIIEAKISAAVMDAMQGTDALIRDLVQRILTMKVDSKGQPSNSSYDKNDYLGWMIRNIIHAQAQEAIKEVCESQKDKIRAEIERQIKSTAMRNRLVATFFDSLTSAAKNGFCMQVNFEENKRY